MDDIKNFVTLYSDRNSEIRIITINGYQMTGVVKSVDCNGLTIISDGRVKFVFYNAISTVEFKC